jgi:hypothetical protein
MAEQLSKLSPHRDLQCYFYQPSAIAALSGASSNAFTLSGSWRQQFDWAVIEWNRDNVFEHPALRYLPDGDLSGITLSYVEQRSGCVPLESNVYPSTDWPYLRLWAPKADGTEDVYFVRLRDYSSPAARSTYQNASATMTLSGTISAGYRVGLAFMGTFASSDDPAQVQIEQHYYYTTGLTDTSLESVAAGIANAINASSPDVTATSAGATVTCIYRGAGRQQDKTGANANRIGVYGFAQQGSTVEWVQSSTTFSGGRFPRQYTTTLNFGQLQGVLNDPTLFFQANIPYVDVPATNVRKARWTWAADIQPQSFIRSEFSVSVSQWTVTGANIQYVVAGPGSRRLEDDNPGANCSGPNGAGDWTTQGPGNYSSSRIKMTEQAGATATLEYTEPGSHSLYLGTRLLAGGASIGVTIDGAAPLTFNLHLNNEDVLARLPLGAVGPGSHVIVVNHNGGASNAGPGPYTFYFDFLEIAYPTANLPEFTSQLQLSLATDWDTLHSQALPAERTAWMISKLGFHGRVNHYTGALAFYELYRPGQQYATLTVNVTVPSSGPTGYSEIDIGSAPSKVTIQHLNLPDDTASSIAFALALRLNQGANAIWAAANGNTVTITARAMGTDGNGLSFAAYSGSNSNVTLMLSSEVLSGGVDGTDVGWDANDPNANAIIALTRFWRTDLTAQPRINRACRDWSQAFFRSLAGYGIDCVATFSTELGHVDPRPSAGMAQRYPDESPVTLNTPAVQTNFSPTSLAFWQEVYLEMAALQAQAGVVPYLQSGEVQWWYFPKPGVGMPFYDAYTTQTFSGEFGTAMQVVLDSNADPAQFPHAAGFLQSLLGNYTSTIRTALKSAYQTARYEVLYPPDVNDRAFNRVVNFPNADWTPANLTCLKTESFSYTSARSLNASLNAMQTSANAGFPCTQRSHLVGIGDATTPWRKEVDLAQAQGLESIVLFALDQFCLIGYAVLPGLQQRWSRRVA